MFVRSGIRVMRRGLATGTARLIMYCFNVVEGNPWWILDLYFVVAQVQS